MTPRQLAPVKPAKAPPKTASAKSEFNRFKERKFGKALELAQSLYVSGYGAIVGTEYVKKRLEDAGIANVVCNPYLANQNEIILNRARDSSESNFFVFLRFSTFKASAFFTDPTSSAEGRTLSKKDLMRRRSVWFSKKKNWAENVASEVLEVSGKKDSNKFFAVLHGHWGENADEGKNRDDGVSSRKDVIRRFMLWHYDIDATGYHNWIHLTALDDIRERERDAGIVKVPSLEFTMPFTPGAENGPHLNFWFSCRMAAMSFWKNFLRDKKINVMPGLAPNVDKRTVLKYIQQMRKSDEMALGIAHPSCILNVIVGRLPVGLLNLLSEKDEKGEYKYNWHAIKSFVKTYADGVGEYNPTLVDYLLRFDDPKVEGYFQRKIGELVTERIKDGGKEVGEAQLEQEGKLIEGKREVGEMAHDVEIAKAKKGKEGTEQIKVGLDAQVMEGAQMRENCISYAFARRMNEKYGTFPYFDHDTHVYSRMKRYERLIGPLAYGRTVFVLGENAMEHLWKNGGMGSKDVVYMMRHRQYRVPVLPAMGEQEYLNESVKIETETFLELDGGRLKPVAPRSDFGYKLKIVRDEIRHGILNAKLVLRDLRNRAGRMFSTHT